MQRRTWLAGMGAAGAIALAGVALGDLWGRRHPVAEPAPLLDARVAEQQEIELVNADRVAAGVPALLVAENLTALARLRAGDMAARHYFSHTDPDGNTALTILQAWQVPYVFAGENIGRVGARTAGAVDAMHRAWLASPDHKANLLFADYTRIGAGVAESDDGWLYFVLLFSREQQDGAGA